MIFPFDILDWLFGIKQNPGQGSDTSGGGIGNWFKSIGGDIASGLEGGFIAFLKDTWDVLRPVLYPLIGAIIMLMASFWYFTGSGSFGTVLSAVAMLAK